MCGSPCLTAGRELEGLVILEGVFFMRHYEIVFMVHPDQSEQVPAMLERYQNLIKKTGKVHRLEDWGRRHLAYPIHNLHKAHYILMNIECDQETLKELTTSFKFNDAVIRNIVLGCEEAITEASAVLKDEDTKKAKAIPLGGEYGIADGVDKAPEVDVSSDNSVQEEQGEVEQGQEVSEDTSEELISKEATEGK